MSQRINHRRPYLLTKNKKTENKFAERKTAWKGTRALAKAKSYAEYEEIMKRLS
jgi:hypothetical protein